MLRPALALLLLGTAAHAAPIANTSADVDGDGTADTIELDDTGTLRVKGSKKATKPASLGPVRQATIGVSQWKGAPLIVVDVGPEAIILELRGDTWRELLRAPLGGQGLDAEYSVAIDPTPQAIYRYQTRPGAKRCDGKPAYLFAEKFNGTKFEPLTKLPVDLKEGTPVIAARLDINTAPESLLFKARFASHQPGASDASALGIPTEIDDGKIPTLWREDIAQSAGEGHFFTYIPRYAGAKATQLRIVPGMQKGMNRPQRLALVSAKGAWHIDLPDAAKDPLGSAYLADLPTPVEGCVTVILESTYGSATGTTAIAELVIFAEGERGGGGDALLARVVAEGKDGSTAAGQALARRGAAGAAAIDAELGRTTDASGRHRLLRVAIDLKDPAAGPVLAKAIAQGQLTGADLLAAIKALAGLGVGAELAELAQKSGIPIEARVAAARALQPTNDKDRDLLVGLAGHGAREVRHAVIDRLSDLPVATLVTIAQAQTDSRRAGDIWRSVTRRAHAKPDERAAASTAMVTALPAATDYEVRYRLVDGVAATGDAPALKLLASTLNAYPLDESTAAYRQVAARAISLNPRNEASDLLVSFTRDRDPGVRLSALAALTQATGTPEGPWNKDAGADGIDRVIITLLSTDTWPEVRRNAAQALGARCSRPGPVAALTDAVSKDADVNVRLDALVGLVECKAPGIAALLATLWDDGKAHLDVRRRAVDLTANLGDMTLAAKLVGKYKGWRGSAIESEAALALAQNAAFAIGRLRPPGAAEALSAALDDSAFPEIVSSAATGLGLLGTACTPSIKKKLTELANSEEEAQVTMAAKRAAAQCGKRAP